MYSIVFCEYSIKFKGCNMLAYKTTSFLHHSAQIMLVMSVSGYRLFLGQNIVVSQTMFCYLFFSCCYGLFLPWQTSIFLILFSLLSQHVLSIYFLYSWQRLWKTLNCLLVWKKYFLFFLDSEMCDSFTCLTHG